MRFLGTAHWQATLHTSNAEAGPLDQQRLPLHALNSRLHYHDGQLQLQTFDWQTAPQGGRIQGQGHYQAAQGWHSQWQLQQLDLATMHSAVQAEPLQGSIQIRSDFSDQHTLANAPVVFESALQSLAGRSKNLLHFDTIALQGRWHEQEAQLSRILVRSRGGTLQGQETRYALISGEQFGAGGVDSVRGFHERVLSNDKGRRVSIELQTPELASKYDLKDIKLRALVFYDAARLKRNKALPGEDSTQAISSFGIGLRGSLKKSLALRLDCGVVNEGGGVESSGSKMVHASIVAYF